MSNHEFKVTLKQVRPFIIEDIRVGLVPYLRSSPGMGKSAMLRSIADEYNLELIDHRLSTSAPEDMSGLPDMAGDKAVFKPFDFLPIEGDELPEGKDGWLLFLDEFNAALKTVQAAAYKLILDRMVGQKKLHPRVKIVCAGNLDTDRAITNPISTAMQSRLIHYIIKGHFQEFMEEVAYPQQWDYRIIAFLNYKKDYLNDFRADHNGLTFSCQRTWEFLNRKVKGKVFDTIKLEDGTYYFTMRDWLPSYAGTITSGVATEFVSFTEIGQEMPKIEQILSDPLGLDIPQRVEIRWCTVSHCVDNADKDNFKTIAEYINRFEANFRVLFFRSLLVRKPELRAHPVFASSMLELNKYLKDDD